MVKLITDNALFDSLNRMRWEFDVDKSSKFTEVFCAYMQTAPPDEYNRGYAQWTKTNVELHLYYINTSRLLPSTYLSSIMPYEKATLVINDIRYSFTTTAFNDQLKQLSDAILKQFQERISELDLNKDRGRAYAALSNIKTIK